MKSTLIALTLVAAAGAAHPHAAQDQDFRWSGRLADGQTVEIRGVNGNVVATGSDGATVRVEADRRGRRDDPRSVRIEVVEHSGGVTICAVYPTPRGARHDNECRPGGGQMSVRDNDVKVDFVVRVPRGVRFADRAPLHTVPRVERTDDGAWHVTGEEMIGRPPHAESDQAAWDAGHIVIVPMRADEVDHARLLQLWRHGNTPAWSGQLSRPATGPPTAPAARPESRRERPPM